MIWQYNPLLIPLAVAGAVCLGLLFFCGRYVATPGVRFFNLLMVAMTVWILSYALELGAIGLANKRFWSLTQYLAIPFVPFFWLTFLLAYSGRRHLLTRTRLVMLSLVPALTAVLALTNPHHGLVIASLRLETGPPVDVLVREFGPWFWVHTFYSYTLLAGGCIVIITSILRSPEDYRGQRASLLLACVLPWLGNAVFIFSGERLDPHIDPTPFILTLTGLLMGWSILQGRLFDVVPVGHDAVIRNMPDGVIILDGQGNVLDINPAALELVRLPPHAILGRPARQVLGACRPILAYGRQADERVDEIELVVGGQAAFYDLQVTAIRRESTIVARLFVLRNITSQRRAHEDKVQGEKLKAALETAGAICHQLNQPLQGISGYAELLLLKAAPESDTRAKIEGIQAEAAKMGTITSKLLNITRYRTARYTAGETIVDIERSSAKDQ